MSAMRAALIAAGIDPDGRADEVRRYHPPRRNRRINAMRSLTDDQVLKVIADIRAGDSPTEIARRYGCHRGSIYAIEGGYSYRDITGGGMIA